MLSVRKSALEHSFSSRPFSTGNVRQRRRCGSPAILAASGRKPWDFGRFVRTVTTFNPPPTPAQVAAAIAVAPLKILKPLVQQDPVNSKQKESTPVPVKTNNMTNAGGAVDAEPKGVVVVAGSTTSLGQQVVAKLLAAGWQVKALVKSSQNGSEIFQGLQAAQGASLTTYAVASSDALPANALQGALAVISCIMSAEDLVEGKAALMEHKELIKGSVATLGLKGGKRLFDAADRSPFITWAPLDDVVMGGCSVSSFSLKENEGEDGMSAVGVFSGMLSTDNSGGFSSIRTLNLDPVLDLFPYKGLRLRLKGDGLRYKFTLKTDSSWDSVQYCQSFDSVAGEWQDIELPFEQFKPVFRAKTMEDWAPLDPRKIVSMQLMLSKFEYDGELNPAFRAGEFSLPLASISAYLPLDLPPRFIHISTTPTISSTEKPPAGSPAANTNERIEQMETELRDSGVPYAILQNADGSLLSNTLPLKVEMKSDGKLMQWANDTFVGQDIADICITLLDMPEACNSTLSISAIADDADCVASSIYG